MTDLLVECSGLMKGSYLPWMVPGLHRHGEIEVNVIEKGSLVYSFGGTLQALHQGDVALFWAAVPHQITRCEESAILHWLNIPFNLFLQWQLPRGLLHDVCSGSFYAGAGAAITPTPLSMFQQWGDDLKADSPEYQKIVLLEVEASLYRFALTNVLQEADDSQQDKRTRYHYYYVPSAQKMARYILEHFTEDIHVREIAAAVYLDQSTAMKLFRRYFGLSILDYLTQCRLSHTQRLLTTTDESIAGLALSSGFGSVSNFYAIFKKNCGIAPHTYRTIYSAMPQPRYDIVFR